VTDNLLAVMVALIMLALAGLSWTVMTTPWVRIIEWGTP